MKNHQGAWNKTHNLRTIVLRANKLPRILCLNHFLLVFTSISKYRKGK